jgi:hypothetical protein
MEFGARANAVAVLCLLFVDKVSETKSKLGLWVHFCLNLVFLVVWVLAIVLFKVNSSADYVWGFACTLEGFQNRLVDYQAICSREVLFFSCRLTKTGTWAITIIAAAIEVAILVLYLLTFIRYQAVLTEREERLRRDEMRRSVHRTMTGLGGPSSNRSRRKGWEAGRDGVITPKINVIPAEEE